MACKGSLEGQSYQDGETGDVEKIKAVSWDSKMAKPHRNSTHMSLSVGVATTLPVLTLVRPVEWNCNEQKQVSMKRKDRINMVYHSI